MWNSCTWLGESNALLQSIKKAFWSALYTGIYQYILVFFRLKIGWLPTDQSSSCFDKQFELPMFQAPSWCEDDPKLLRVKYCKRDILYLSNETIIGTICSKARFGVVWTFGNYSEQRSKIWHFLEYLRCGDRIQGYVLDSWVSRKLTSFDDQHCITGGCFFLIQCTSFSCWNRYSTSIKDSASYCWKISCSSSSKRSK